MGKTHFNMSVPPNLATKVGEARRDRFSRHEFYIRAVENLVQDIEMQKRGYDVVYRKKDNPNEVIVRDSE